MINQSAKFVLLLAMPFICFGKPNDDTLTIVTEHLPPYQIVDQHHHISGFSTELIHQMMQYTDIDYTVVANTWTRSYNLALKQPNTCIYSIARRPLREDKFIWIGELTRTHAVFFGARDKQPDKINTLEQAKKYTVAVVKDDITHQALLARGFSEQQNLYVVDSTNSLLKLLISRDDIDLILADDITLPYRAQVADVDFNKVKRLFQLDDLPLNFYIACQLETKPIWVKALRSALATIHKNGQYQQILNKWQGIPPLEK